MGDGGVGMGNQKGGVGRFNIYIWGGGGRDRRNGKVRKKKKCIHSSEVWNVSYNPPFPHATTFSSFYSPLHRKEKKRRKKEKFFFNELNSFASF